MSRWKAAGIHLAISAVAIIGIFVALLFTWYPPGLTTMAEADRLMLILGGVDIAIGPLLTLIVYQAGKKSLKFDLAIIALLQVAALGYGLHIFWQSRPVFMVAAVDRFELVFANEIDPMDLSLGSRPEFKTLSWSGARLVGAKLPTRSQDRLQAIMQGIDGRDIHLTPVRYADYREVASSLLRHARPLDHLTTDYPTAAQALTEAAQRLGRTADSVRYVPIISSRGRASMLLDARTGEIVGPAAVDPWPDLAAP